MALEKSTRAELIAALVTDKYSGFLDGDETILEACSDARLEQFRSAADGAKAAASNLTRVETDLRNTSARLKVAEERIKTNEQELSEDDFMARAPGSIKTLIENHKAEEAAFRASLISQLKDCGADTEETLKKKSTDDLKTLAAYARVEVPDFSGRGVVTERHASENSKVTYAPPDPYAPGLKVLREQTKH